MSHVPGLSRFVKAAIGIAPVHNPSTVTPVLAGQAPPTLGGPPAPGANPMLTSAGGLKGVGSFTYPRGAKLAASATQPQAPTTGTAGPEPVNLRTQPGQPDFPSSPEAPKGPTVVTPLQAQARDAGAMQAQGASQYDLPPGAGPGAPAGPIPNPFGAQMPANIAAPAFEAANPPDAGAGGGLAGPGAPMAPESGGPSPFWKKVWDNAPLYGGLAGGGLLAGGLLTHHLMNRRRREDEDEEKPAASQVKSAEIDPYDKVRAQTPMLGALLGAAGGGAAAPRGYLGQGTLRGGLLGAGTGLGALLGHRFAQSQGSAPDSWGSLAGAAGGTLGGYGLSRLLLEQAPWDRAREEREKRSSSNRLGGLIRKRAAWRGPEAPDRPDRAYVGGRYIPRVGPRSQVNGRFSVMGQGVTHRVAAEKRANPLTNLAGGVMSRAYRGDLNPVKAINSMLGNAPAPAPKSSAQASRPPAQGTAPRPPAQAPQPPRPPAPPAARPELASSSRSSGFRSMPVSAPRPRGGLLISDPVLARVSD